MNLLLYRHSTIKNYISFIIRMRLATCKILTTTTTTTTANVVVTRKCITPYNVPFKYCSRWNSSHNTSTPSSTTTTPQSTTNNHVVSLVQYLQSVILKCIQWYSNKLESHPMLIKGITSGIIAASGDVLCQYMTSKVTNNNITTTVTDTTKTTDTSPLIATTTPNENDDHDHRTLLQQQQQQQYWWDVNRTIRFGILGSCYIAPFCHVWYNALARWFPINVFGTIRTTTLATAAATTATTTTSSSAIIPLLKRVTLDQFVFTPILLIGWLLSLLSLETMFVPSTSSSSSIAFTATTSNNNPTNSSSNNSNTSISTVSTTTTTTSTDSCTYQDNRIISILQKYYTIIIIEKQFSTILMNNWLLWIPVQTINFYSISTKYQVLFTNCIALLWNSYLSYMTSIPLSNNTKK